MKYTKQHVTTHHYATCDGPGCGEPARYECSLCKRDVCDRHVVYDDRDSGDYPTKYCPDCWRIGTPFRAKMHQANAEHDALIERLEAEWREAATQKERTP